MGENPGKSKALFKTDGTTWGYKNMPIDFKGYFMAENCPK